VTLLEPRKKDHVAGVIPQKDVHTARTPGLNMEKAGRSSSFSFLASDLLLMPLTEPI
jgi:hypothetical protein